MPRNEEVSTSAPLDYDPRYLYACWAMVPHPAGTFWMMPFSLPCPFEAVWSWLELRRRNPDTTDHIPLVDELEAVRQHGIQPWGERGILCGNMVINLPPGFLFVHGQLADDHKLRNRALFDRGWEDDEENTSYAADLQLSNGYRTRIPFVAPKGMPTDVAAHVGNPELSGGKISLIESTGGIGIDLTWACWNAVVRLALRKTSLDEHKALVGTWEKEGTAGEKGE